MERADAGRRVGGQAGGRIDMHARRAHPVADHRPGSQGAADPFRLSGRSRWVDWCRTPTSGDHSEMHGAKGKRVVNVDQYPGSQRYLGYVELLAPELRSGAQCGEVQRPLAACIGQEAPMCRTRGARSDKLTDGIHAAHPDLAT